MPDSRLSRRWSTLVPRLVPRLAAVATALLAALVVVLLAAACARVPAPATAATPAPAPIESPTRLESPALAEAEALGQRLALARLAAAAGARGALTEDQWRDQHPLRIEDVLVGRFAGVQVTRTLDGLSIRIRGVSTLLGDPEPLVVLDGQPLASGARELAMLNPADVARIEVLKDGGSTAFYGVRGSNGVLLVTTKRPPRPAR